MRIAGRTEGGQGEDPAHHRELEVKALLEVLT